MSTSFRAFTEPASRTFRWRCLPSGSAFGHGPVSAAATPHVIAVRGWPPSLLLRAMWKSAPSGAVATLMSRECNANSLDRAACRTSHPAPSSTPPPPRRRCARCSSPTSTSERATPRPAPCCSSSDASRPGTVHQILRPERVGLGGSPGRHHAPTPQVWPRAARGRRWCRSAIRVRSVGGVPRGSRRRR